MLKDAKELMNKKKKPYALPTSGLGGKMKKKRRWRGRCRVRRRMLLSIPGAAHPHAKHYLGFASSKKKNKQQVRVPPSARQQQRRTKLFETKVINLPFPNPLRELEQGKAGGRQSILRASPERAAADAGQVKPPRRAGGGCLAEGLAPVSTINTSAINMQSCN